MSDTLDPTQAADASFKRSAFVGLSASAAVALGSRAALAADDLGKPHAPFVAEDDPALTIDHPTFDSARPEGATAITAYAAAPKDAAAWQTVFSEIRYEPARPASVWRGTGAAAVAGAWQQARAAAWPLVWEG